MTRPELNDSHEPPLWLHRADQATAAGLLVALLVCFAAFLAWQGFEGPAAVEREAAEAREAGFQVDINRAEWPELAMLPGIGESLAKAIVLYREQQGAFRRLDDLQQVRGIGPKIFAEALPWLQPLENGHPAAAPGGP